MLYGLMVTLFIILCFIIIALVLIQKGKGGMGIGSMGGSSQMLFGGSGGQDFFQKATWVLCAVFMLGSLGLGLMKSHYLHDTRYLKVDADETSQQLPLQAAPTAPLTEQSAPVSEPAAPAPATTPQPAAPAPAA